MLVPGSKSETNRALVLAALADGPSTITGGLSSRDSDLMRAALGALGVRIEESAAGWHVTPPAHFAEPVAPIDCGLAGTVMRFVPPVAMLNRGTTRFVGDPHASERPMGPLLDGMAQLGVQVDADRLPFTQVAPALVAVTRVVIDAAASSQFVSALLLVGARLPQGLELVHSPAVAGAEVPSRPHVDMTVHMLRSRGIEVDEPQPGRWLVSPGIVRAMDQQVEPDLTSAAVFLAAAAVTRGVVRVPGWPAQTTQGGAAIVDLLRRAGAECHLADGVLTVRGTGTVRGLGEADLHASSELTPVVAALAALADGPTTITGVAHIRGHETDRLAALETELAAAGAEVVQTEDGLRIVGHGAGPLHGRVWHTYADHRIAHAAALVGLLVPGTGLDDVACTTKTIADFPGLWGSMLGHHDGRAG